MSERRILTDSLTTLHAMPFPSSQGPEPLNMLGFKAKRHESAHGLRGWSAHLEMGDILDCPGGPGVIIFLTSGRGSQEGQRREDVRTEAESE